MREVGAASGLKVADVGAGKGFFTVAAAELVGEGGFVFAVEPDPDRIKIIRRRCDEARLTNVRFLEKKAEEMNQIDAESLDSILHVRSSSLREPGARTFGDKANTETRGGDSTPSTS